MTRLLLAVGLIQAQKGKRTCSTEILNESFMIHTVGMSSVSKSVSNILCIDVEQ